MRITFGLTCPWCKQAYTTRRMLNNKTITANEDIGGPVAKAIADVIRNVTSEFHAHVSRCEKGARVASAAKYRGDDDAIHEKWYRIDDNSQFKALHTGPAIGVSGFRRDAKIHEAPQPLVRNRTYRVRKAAEAPWLIVIVEVETELKL